MTRPVNRHITLLHCSKRNKAGWLAGCCLVSSPHGIPVPAAVGRLLSLSFVALGNKSHMAATAELVCRILFEPRPGLCIILYLHTLRKIAAS